MTLTRILHEENEAQGKIAIIFIPWIKYFCPRYFSIP